MVMLGGAMSCCGLRETAAPLLKSNSLTWTGAGLLAGTATLSAPTPVWAQEGCGQLQLYAGLSWNISMTLPHWKNHLLVLHESTWAIALSCRPLCIRQYFDFTGSLL